MRIGIIGGGVYGTALAYFLEKIGSSNEILLFEKNSLGSASTGKSAGVVRHHYSDEIQVRFAKRGREILEELPEMVGTDGGFHQNGYLIMAGSESEEQFRRNVKLQQKIGLDVDFVAPEELEDYVPALDAEEIAVAAIEREAGFADPYLVATGFAEKAQTLGTEIYTNTPVTDIETKDGEVVAVKSNSSRYEVDFVVNAAGPWAAEIAEMVDIDLPLSRYEAKIVSLTSSTSYPPKYPTVSDVDLGLVAKPEASGDFIAGGIERENGHESISGREELEGVTNENLEYLGEALEDRLPGYADAEIVDSWSELITAPPDWHQIIGSSPSVDNFYIVAGGSGHGFKEAPGFAESIAESILGHESSIDLSRYRLDRFETGDVFTGGYGDGTRS